MNITEYEAIAKITSKYKTALDANPEYAQAKADRNKALDQYKEMCIQKEKLEADMDRAEANEEEARKKMTKIQKKVIADLISDPAVAEAFYRYYIEDPIIIFNAAPKTILKL